jgi:hypothetical protein
MRGDNSNYLSSSRRCAGFEPKTGPLRAVAVRGGKRLRLV